MIEGTATESEKFKGIKFEYGMNAPEPDWIWSTNDFGFSITRPGQFLVLQGQINRNTCTIDVYGGNLGSRRYTPHNGSFKFVLDLDDQIYHLRVRPKLSLASDVRELGILIENILIFEDREALERYKWPDRAVDLEPCPSDFRPALREDSSRILSDYIYRSFAEGGWANAHFHQNRLTLSYVPKFATLSGSHLDLDVVINGVTKRRAFTLLTSPTTRVQESTVYCAVDIAGVTGLNFEDAQFDAHIVGHEWQSFHWRGYGGENLPDSRHIVRVAGGPVTLQSFCFGGATWQTKLVRLIENYLVSKISEIGDILDWGCGCGRIARFFDPGARGRLYGADIDSVNIEWCRRNLAAAEWSVVSATPPLPYPNEKFDVIYGHSVFTHIAEEAQFEWLAELNRVLKLGGLCLVTVNAELSMFSRYYPDGRPYSSLVDYLDQGFFDDGWLDVGVDAASPGAYRTTTHSYRYIMTRWSAHFDVLALIPGFADLQTLAVLRKRS